jgi:hypothetical protein
MRALTLAVVFQLTVAPPAIAQELARRVQFSVGIVIQTWPYLLNRTARYLNVKDDYLQELIERKPFVLVKK